MSNIINEIMNDKVFDIMENAKRVARQKYGMYLKHGELIVDKTRYMGKMKIDDEECMSIVLKGLDDLLTVGLGEYDDTVIDGDKEYRMPSPEYFVKNATDDDMERWYKYLSGVFEFEKMKLDVIEKRADG